MLEKAREFILAQGVTNALFQVADAEQLPFSSESFDRVTCRIAPHHFPDLSKFVFEVARVLKTGGLFLLIDCMAPSDEELDIFDNTIEKWRDPSHGRSCTSEEWQALLKEADLSIEHMEFFRKTHEYDDWTARSQMPLDEKARLSQYILESNNRIQTYFEIVQKPDGQLASFTNDFIFHQKPKECVMKLNYISSLSHSAKCSRDNSRKVKLFSNSQTKRVLFLLPLAAPRGVV